MLFRSRDVAVLPFERGGTFSASLESALASARVDDKPYFTVVDRQKLSELTKEMSLGQSGLIDANTAARIGQLTGAKALYVGTVTRETVELASGKDDLGTMMKAALRGIQFCYWRTATLSVTPKLVDTQSGRIVYSRSVLATAKSDSCVDDKLATEGELKQRALNDALKQIVADVTPHYADVKIDFLNVADGIASNTGKEQLDRGMINAGNHRLDKACDIWRAALSENSNSVSLVFNVGVCAEVGGNFDEALSQYKKADKLYTGAGSAPNDPSVIIGNAMNRVQEILKKRGA